MSTRLIATRLPTPQEHAEHGGEVVFVRRDERGYDHKVFAGRCYESWQQWGVATPILGENVEAVEAWRRALPELEAEDDDEDWCSAAEHEFGAGGGCLHCPATRLEVEAATGESRPLFSVVLRREVVTTESVTRQIRAATADEAAAIADQMASEFDDDCPDDAAGDSTDCQSWHADQPQVIP